MENYKPNSFRSKEQPELTEECSEKNVGKVISGTVKLAKKSGLQKLVDMLINQDTQTVKEYIIMDVVLPAVKTAVSDIVTKGIDILLYGDGGKSRKWTDSTKDFYNRCYSVKEKSYRDCLHTVGDYDDIVLSTRGDAEIVLRCMEQFIEECGMVRVADLYDLIGKSSTYTDNYYGWTDIHNARIERVKDGYLLKLPRAETIR